MSHAPDKAEHVPEGIFPGEPTWDVAQLTLSRRKGIGASRNTWDSTPTNWSSSRMVSSSFCPCQPSSINGF